MPLWQVAQDWLEPVLGPGSVVVDATCGNGGDTGFLARRIGSGGTVIGFDFQEEAIRRTEAQLHGEGLGATLLAADHANLDEILTDIGVTEVNGGIFNLGYLPGGDPSIITRPDSTCCALQALLDRAAANFRLSVVSYRGHPGGEAEFVAVREFLGGAESNDFDLHVRSCRNAETGPVFLGLKRTSDLSAP